MKFRIRKLREYVSWRTSVYKRDEFVCQFCKKKGGYLNADHIKPFSVIFYENNITSIKGAKKCQELWDINNGRTLCVPCHKKTDTYLNINNVVKYSK